MCIFVQIFRACAPKNASTPSSRQSSTACATPSRANSLGRSIACSGAGTNKFLVCIALIQEAKCPMWITSPVFITHVRQWPDNAAGQCCQVLLPDNVARYCCRTMLPDTVYAVVVGVGSVCLRACVSVSVRLCVCVPVCLCLCVKQNRPTRAMMTLKRLKISRLNARFQFDLRG
jgi:hypothetical protein